MSEVYLRLLLVATCFSLLVLACDRLRAAIRSLGFCCVIVFESRRASESSMRSKGRLAVVAKVGGHIALRRRVDCAIVR